MRLLLLLLALCAAAASEPPPLVRDFDAGALVTALATQSVVVTFHTRWCGAQPARRMRAHTAQRCSRVRTHTPQVRAVHRRGAGAGARGGGVHRPAGRRRLAAALRPVR
jgi:hypothetical protein